GGGANDSDRQRDARAEQDPHGPPVARAGREPDRVADQVRDDAAGEALAEVLAAPRRIGRRWRWHRRGKVGGERCELCVCPRRVRLADALVELVGVEPALGGRCAQAVGDGVALGVGGPLVWHTPRLTRLRAVRAAVLTISTT